MKRVVQIKLQPSPEQEILLRATLRACNDAANRVSDRARELAGPGGRVNGYDLRAVTYGSTKTLVPGAQAAQQVIRKVVAAYATHRANLRAGRYGKRGTPRREQADRKVLRFRPTAAQPYDDRILSWKHETSTVSIWTLDGRQKIPFVGREADLELIAAHRKGESDLLERDGVFYLIVTLELPDVPVAPPQGFLGVDLGIVQIVAVADETGSRVFDWSGGAVTARRERNRKLRQRLQAKHTKSAKRLLKKRSKKERRFATDINHQISKRIVAEAERTAKGVAVEELTGIRERVRHRRPQRATFHSWAFAQLGGFITYKAQAAGVAFLQVDPRHTSQICSRCGNHDKRARRSQALYSCTNPACGVSLNADHNAAVNIARRGAAGWAAVNLPNAA